MMPAVVYDDLRNELYAPAYLLSANPRFEVMSSLLLPPQTQSLRLDSPSLLTNRGHKRANDNLILIDSEDLKSRHNQNQVVTKSKTTFSDSRKHSSVFKLYSYAQVWTRSTTTLASHPTQDEYGDYPTRLSGKALAVLPLRVRSSADPNKSLDVNDAIRHWGYFCSVGY
jgi:hypothetical protein